MKKANFNLLLLFSILFFCNSYSQDNTLNIPFDNHNSPLENSVQNKSNRLASNPTITITGSKINFTSSPFTATFTFSENIQNFSLSDIVVTKATTSVFNKINESKYTALITPTTDGVVTVDIPANSLQDLANNDNLASNTFSITYDTTKPKAAITSDKSNPTNATSFVATFTFSEDVADFDETYFTLTNANSSSFVYINDALFKATITSITEGTVTVTIPENEVEDNAGNSTLTTQLSINVDTTKPTTTITSSVTNYTNTAFTSTITFSEDVIGFDINDITLGNATISNFVARNAKTYSALITPISEGIVTVDVANNKATDLATNENVGANQFSTTFDSTKPTVIITADKTNPTNAASFVATFTFSEDISGFDELYFSVTNGSTNNFTTISNSVYKVTITPLADGTVTINLLENKVEDNTGNQNVAAQFSIDIDTSKPATTLLGIVVSPTKLAFTTTVTFTEDVTGFDINDIIISNATASNFAATNAKSYSVLITPTIDGIVTVDVANNAAFDIANNGNSAGNQISTTFDGTKPSVIISADKVNPTNATSFVATFTFSEDVTSFDINDITLNNATASNFTTTNAKVYSVLITPISDGIVTINIASNVANDTATNGNNAAAQFSITYDSTKPTTPSILSIDNYTCSSDTSTTGDNTLVFNGTSEPNSTVEIFINTVSAGNTTTNTNGTWSFDYTSVTLLDATYNVTSKARDASNNASDLSLTFTIKVNTIDTDGDLIYDFCDDDDDNDGILDTVDNSYLPNPGQEDTDGDGLADVEEDCDNDGIINYFDTDVATCQSAIVLKKKYGFSPNGDGINDTWAIENIVLYPNNMVRVFNRSGKLVYQMKGYNNSFNGFSNKVNSGKKLPVGAYYFTIEFNTPNSKPAKGWLYINY